MVQPVASEALLSLMSGVFPMAPQNPSLISIGAVAQSFGCEKSTHPPSPIHSWKRIRPSVVSASKSGAVSPS